MHIPESERLPRRWNDDELAVHQKRALNAFVDRRLAEPSTRYSELLRARRSALHRLVRLLAPIDPAQPDIAVVRQILLDTELQSALRYIAGPPISDDDLGVVVTRDTKRLTKRRIRSDATLATDILRLICKLADPQRFPWVSEQGRAPRLYESSRRSAQQRHYTHLRRCRLSDVTMARWSSATLKNGLSRPVSKRSGAERRQDHRANSSTSEADLFRRVHFVRTARGSSHWPAGWPRRRCRG